MLRLPAALVEDISIRSGSLSSLSLTCSALWRVLNQPETQLRFYLTAQRRRCLNNSCASFCSWSTGIAGSIKASCSTQSSTDPAAAACGPATVYGLLTCRARPKDAQGALRLLELMLTCSSMVHLVPEAQQDSVQHMLASTGSGNASRALELLQTVLPHAEHCLLHFCAASGHLQLVKLLLPRCIAPVRLHGVLHYVKTSAFLAAAAGMLSNHEVDVVSCPVDALLCTFTLSALTSHLFTARGWQMGLVCIGLLEDQRTSHYAEAAQHGD